MSFVIPSLGTPTSPGGPTTSTRIAQELIDQAWRYLYAGTRVERTRLAADISDSQSTATFAHALKSMVQGAKLSIDLEDLFVYVGASDFLSATDVGRGEFGSAKAVHSSGAVVHMDAPYSPWDIFREMNNELASLSSPDMGLFRIGHVDLTYNPSVMGYDLTGTGRVDEIIRVQTHAIGPENEWPVLTNWRFEALSPTGSFTSGNALQLYEGADPSQTIRVTYKGPYSLLESVLDNVEDQTGLHGEAHLIPALGAVLRLAAPEEISRNRTDAQGDTRRSAEVPAGAKRAAFTGVAAMRQQKIGEEANRLARLYPRRRRRH